MAVEAEVLVPMPAPRSSKRSVGWLQSLRGRLMLVLFAVGIIPVVVTGLLSLRLQQKVYLELSGRILSETAQHLGQLLDRHFAERYGDVHAQSQSPIVQAMNPAALPQHLDYLVQGYRPAYVLIAVSDTAGNIIATNRLDAEGKPLPVERLAGLRLPPPAWGNDAAIEDLHQDPILKALFGPGAESWTVTFSMPVERAGKVVGAVRMFCDWRAVQEMAAAAVADARANGYAAADIRLIGADGRSYYSNASDFMRSVGGNPIAAAAQQVKATGSMRGDGLAGEGEVVAGFYRTRGHGAFPGLGWSVVASQPVRAAKTAMRSDMDRSLIWIVALLVALALVFVSALLANHLTKPLDMMAGSLRNLASAEADLSHRLPEDRGDEIGVVSRSFNTFVDKLQGNVDQVVRAGMQVMMSSTQIAAGARELEATMTEQVAATNEVVATTNEIAATANDLASTMGAVAKMSEETAQAATHGRRDVDRMAAAVSGMESATQAVSARLAVINEKAGNIASVVTTITKVADQTNLLSLNAAIEAEKAGQFGAGFAVVAREIRRLADQAALATLDIEKMVKEMKAAVASGVSSMETLNEQMQDSVRAVRQAGVQMETIISQVQEVTPRFETARVGMQAQREGAAQISQAMSQLSESTQQTASALSDSNRAIGELNDAATSLQSMFARFKLTAA